MTSRILLMSSELSSSFNESEGCSALLSFEPFLSSEDDEVCNLVISLSPLGELWSWLSAFASASNNDPCCLVTIGPTSDKRTGSNIKPTPHPRHTIAKNDLKTTINIVAVENARGMTPKSVVRPPRRMLAPMVSKVSFTFSCLVFPGVS